MYCACRRSTADIKAKAPKLHSMSISYGCFACHSWKVHHLLCIMTKCSLLQLEGSPIIEDQYCKLCVSSDAWGFSKSTKGDSFRSL